MVKRPCLVSRYQRPRRRTARTNSQARTRCPRAIPSARGAPTASTFRPLWPLCNSWLVLASLSNSWHIFFRGAERGLTQDFASQQTFSSTSRTLRCEALTGQWQCHFLRRKAHDPGLLRRRQRRGSWGRRLAFAVPRLFFYRWFSVVHPTSTHYHVLYHSRLDCMSSSQFRCAS